MNGRIATNQLINKYIKLPVQVKASVWYLACSFLQKATSMITVPIFTRILSTSEYGQFGVFNSWLGIITIIVSLNLYAGVHAQGIVKFSEERSQFTSSLQGLTIVLVTTWVIIYLALHELWNRVFSLTTTQMLSMMIIIWTTAIYNFWANEERLRCSYKAIAIITIFVTITKSILEIVLAQKSRDKVTAVILGWLIVEVVAYTWMLIAQMNKGKVFFSKRFWKYALFFNLPLVPHYLSQTVLNSADRIMIRDMIGESEAGIYNLAYSVSLIMTLFNTALAQTISPWMYQKIKDKKEKEIAPVAYISLILVAGVNLLLIIFAPEIVWLFAPASYYEAIYIIPPVAMSVFFMYAYDLFAKFSFYYEKTKMVMIASLFGAILNIVLNYVFIRKYGYIAAGYTTLVCYMAYAVTHFFFMRKVCHDFCDGVYPYETKKLIIIAVPFLLVGGLFLVTYKVPVIRYGIILGTVLCVFIFRNRILEIIKKVLNP